MIMTARRTFITLVVICSSADSTIAQPQQTVATQLGGHSFATGDDFVPGGTSYHRQVTANFADLWPRREVFDSKTPSPTSPARTQHLVNFSSPMAGLEQVPLSSAVRLNPELTQPLMDFQNRQSDKELLLLDPTRNGGFTPGLDLGAQFRASAMFGTTNTADKFSYLGRFPTDFSGTTVTDARLVHANQAFVGHFTPWANGYMETLFSDVFSFAAAKQGSFQVRQAYVTVGDLSQSPFYAFAGKKTVSFGDMGTLSPFSQSMVWHYFSPLAEGIGGGYAVNGFNLSVTALNGSRGIRVADSDEKGHLNNVAVNALFDFPLWANAGLSLGGGFLRGTIYDGLTAEHLDASVTGEFNSIWDVNAAFHWGPWVVEGEYVETFEPWPVTSHRVSAYRLETAWDLVFNGKLVRVSGSWSEGVQGPAGSEFEFNRQLVIGISHSPAPNVRLALEYVRSSGFAPLIAITNASDKGVVQDSIVLGMVLTI
jgi:hypothetical protein